MAQDENISVYETVMAYYGKKFNVIKFSSKRTLNQAYFQDPLRMELHVRDTLNDDWTAFLKSIDTSKVMTGPINTEFVKKHSNVTGGYVRDVLFSPVIYSENSRMAVCGVYTFRRGAGHGENIILLEKKKRKWIVRKVYFISIS
ncbi:hypothetical protein GCM10028827_12000 [Mucilaginibacter myungsuensis]